MILILTYCTLRVSKQYMGPKLPQQSTCWMDKGSQGKDILFTRDQPCQRSILILQVEVVCESDGNATDPEEVCGFTILRATKKSPSPDQQQSAFFFFLPFNVAEEIFNWKVCRNFPDLQRAFLCQFSLNLFRVSSVWVGAPNPSGSRRQIWILFKACRAFKVLINICNTQWSWSRKLNAKVAPRLYRLLWQGNSRRMNIAMA